MAIRPFQPLFPNVDAATATVGPTVPDRLSEPDQFVVLYVLSRSRNTSSNKPYSNDGILSVGAQGTAVLRDADTGEEVARCKLRTSYHDLYPGKSMFVGDRRVEIQEKVTGRIDVHHDMTVYAVTDPAQERTGTPQPATSRPFRRHEVLAKKPGDFFETCSECEAKSHACDGGFPCGTCLIDKEKYCTRRHVSSTELKRAPVNKSKVLSLPPGCCHNCTIFKLACDGRSPCLTCVEHSRAYCSVIDDDKAVHTILCGAYHIVQDPLRNSRVTLSKAYSPDPEERFETWPLPRLPTHSVNATKRKDDSWDDPIRRAMRAGPVSDAEAMNLFKYGTRHPPRWRFL
ncbi:hypothetical protein J1614_012282 [Plenodomus biglobosus]|nr:hypothetical protein J1614_012282 [Plenodomus biglobosus]